MAGINSNNLFISILVAGPAILIYVQITILRMRDALLLFWSLWSLYQISIK